MNEERITENRRGVVHRAGDEDARYGHRDATMILLAFRHGLRWPRSATFVGIKSISKAACSTSAGSRTAPRAHTPSRATSSGHYAGSSARARPRRSCSLASADRPFTTAGSARMIERAAAGAGLELKAVSFGSTTPRSLSKASLFSCCICQWCSAKCSRMGFSFAAKHSMPVPSKPYPTNRRLAKDQRKALGMLAASVRGRIDSVMLAHGFAVGTLHSLVREGLATADRGPAYFDPRAIVTMLQITDAGRRAIGI
jgi:hypothetical protein